MLTQNIKKNKVAASKIKKLKTKYFTNLSMKKILEIYGFNSKLHFLGHRVEKLWIVHLAVVAGRK